MSSPVRSRPKLAYLTGEYPAVSHTFILREVTALRELGFDIDTCSIRRTGAEHHRGSAEKDAVRTTFYVLAAAMNPVTFLRAQGAALAHPRRWFSALRLAWKTRPPGLRALLYQLIYLAEAAVLARHLKVEGVDHLHNHFGDSSCSVAMLTSVLADIPYSYSMHGPAIFFAPRKWRIDEKMARARFVACISHFCRSQGMIYANPEDWRKLRIVHCGVDPARYDTGPRDAPGKQILFVGRLASVKGVPILLEAFADIQQRHPDAHMTLIGDGPERASIVSIARSLGLESSVTFAGYQSQEEVAASLAGADLLVLPSFAEGVPVVLMEAMAARLPVVATRIAGIGELVEHGISGLTVSPGDASALAGAMDTLLLDPDRMRRMGEAGRKKVLSEFDGKAEAKRLGTLFCHGSDPDHIWPAHPRATPHQDKPSA